MQTQITGIPPFAFFDRVAGTIVGPRGLVDARGMTRDDYAQDLVMFALKARPAVSPQAENPAAVIAAWTWRQAMSYARTATRRRRLREKHEVRHESTLMHDPVAHLENRACVRHLERRLSPSEFQALALVKTLGLAEAVARTGIPRSSLAARSSHALAKARAALED